MPTRFVVLSQHRTGSTMLMDTLQSHPDIRCYGELFVKVRKKAQISQVPWPTRIDPLGIPLERISPYLRDTLERFEHPHEFLEEVFSLDPEAKFVGFKLMLNQHPECRRMLIRDKRFRKILLVRDNVLASFASSEITHATGQSYALEGEKSVDMKVPFDAGRFKVFSRRSRHQLQEATDELERSGQNYLRLTYLDIAQRRGIEDVMKFVGADSRKEWRVTHKKRNTSVILDRFTNPVDAERFLLECGLEHWREEPMIASGEM